MKLKRKLVISEAYDKRHKDPSKNYGISACRIFFSVTGKDGAISVNFGTNWYLKSTVDEYKKGTTNTSGQPLVADLEKDSEPLSAYSWGYHSRVQKYEGQDKTEDCNFLNGDDCYYDSSCLKANDFKDILLKKGSDGVFEQLEKDYKNEFGDEE